MWKKCKKFKTHENIVNNKKDKTIEKIIPPQMPLTALLTHFTGSFNILEIAYLRVGSNNNFFKNNLDLFKYLSLLLEVKNNNFRVS